MTTPTFTLVEPSQRTWTIVMGPPCMMEAQDGYRFEFCGGYGDTNRQITQPGCDILADFMDANDRDTTAYTLTQVLDMAGGDAPNTLAQDWLVRLTDMQTQITELTRKLDLERAQHRATERLAEQAAKGANQMMYWAMEEQGRTRLMRNTLTSIANGIPANPFVRAREVLAQPAEQPGDPLLKDLLDLVADALGNGHHEEPDSYVINADTATALTIRLLSLGVILG